VAGRLRRWIVIVGITALRIACLATILRSLSPRARAASMWSVRSTSSRLDRSVRTTITASASPNVSAGSVSVRRIPPSPPS